MFKWWKSFKDKPAVIFDEEYWFYSGIWDANTINIERRHCKVVNIRPKAC